MCRTKVQIILRIQRSFFLMTDSICHSSLPRTVLEKVTLTTIQFCIHPRTKVDPMFQCVCILVRHWRAVHTKVVQRAWSMARVAEKTHLNICANNKGADQPVRPRRLISAFVVRCSSFVRRRSVSQTQMENRMIPGIYSFLIEYVISGLFSPLIFFCEMKSIWSFAFRLSAQNLLCLSMLV